MTGALRWMIRSCGLSPYLSMKPTHSSSVLDVIVHVYLTRSYPLKQSVRLDISATMGRSLVFLTANQIVRLYRTRIIASMPTQPPLLESAISSPVNQHHYTSTDDVFYLAAVLAQKIMLNHSFSDGNKRTSVAAADMFLRLNGFQLTPAEESSLVRRGRFIDTPEDTSEHGFPSSLADAHVAVASGLWDEEKLARFYRKVARPLKRFTRIRWRVMIPGTHD